MSKPYDASTKYLVEAHLPDWLTLSAQQSTNRVETIEADLSTVTAAADKVLLVHDPIPWILHLELLASWEKDFADKLSWYNSLLEYRHHCLVHSLVVLLRRQADSPLLSGVAQKQLQASFPIAPSATRWLASGNGPWRS